MTSARERVLEQAGDGLAWTKSGLAHAAGVSPGVIDGLRDQGVFAPVHLPPPPVVAAPEPDYNPADLEASQLDAANTLRRSVASGGFGVTLLDGVTGSGKTEVYFEAIAEAIQAGPAGSDPVAGDRADKRLSRPVPRPLRSAAGGMAFGAGAADAREGLAAGVPRTASAWWRARARRCSCRLPISA
jgi:hypothetical protein